MTIRTRFALLASSLVLLVVAAVGIGAYVVAGQQLRNQVDNSLTARAALIVRALERDGRPNLDDGDRIPRPIINTFLQTEFDAVTQYIDSTGHILASAGPVDLPITSADIKLSNRSRGYTRGTETVKGDPYRVLTVSLGDGSLIKVAKNIHEIENARNGMRLWFLFIGALGFLLAGGLGWLLASRASRPIQDLAHTAEDIAATQDLGHEIPVEGDAEVQQLSRSFNTMLAALRASTNRQRQLVQDASHELRTPLTSLRANTELLERSSLNDADRAAILADMRAEVDELSELSSELSALATDHRTAEEVASLNMFEVAEEVAQRARRRTNGAITVTGDSSAVVVARPQQFERALSNLVDNAIKFGPLDSPIDVVVSHKDIRVRDTGPGISDADKPNVFDRFYRATATRSMPGSGLGLAIVRQFADDNGATTFVDDAPGGGAIVGIRFH